MATPHALYKKKLGFFKSAGFICPAGQGAASPMNDFLDIYTLVFLALAVFVIFRLRSVLGERTGNEKPPFDPFTRPDPKTPAPDSNVVPLPTANARAPADVPAPPSLDERLQGIADPVSPLGTGLKQIMTADASFVPREFLQGARAAYEMIVLAFARGDRKGLKDLLSKDVFDGFNSVITQREQNNLKAEATFISLDKAEIVEAEMKGRSMEVSVRFASKLINVTRDAAGTVVEGSADTITDVVDIWTFAREAGSRDPNWRLVGTETGQ